MYAFVRASGRQERVEVGSTISINRPAKGPATGSEVEFSPVLLVDGADVVTDPASLAKCRVRGTVLDAFRGPKIRIVKFKNKTGYRRRMGHRQNMVNVKITEIAK